MTRSAKRSRVPIAIPIVCISVPLFSYAAKEHWNTRTSVANFDAHMKFNNDFMEDDRVQEVMEVIRGSSSDDDIDEKLRNVSPFNRHHFLAFLNRLAACYNLPRGGLISLKDIDAGWGSLIIWVVRRKALKGDALWASCTDGKNDLQWNHLEILFHDLERLHTTRCRQFATS